MLKDLLYNGILIKQSYVEQPDGNQFEKDFNGIAYAFLQDRAAPLVQYLLGFEIVKRSPDGTRGVGIFGFKLGKTLYYIPVFFLNGQIKGMDSIIDTKKNQFYPLDEDWIDTLIGRQPVNIGEGASESERSSMSHPDVSETLLPPMSKLSESVDINAAGGIKKIALDVLNCLDNNDKFQEILAGIISVKTANDLPLYNKAESSIVKYIKKANNPRIANTLLEWVASDENFIKAASEFYNLPDDFDIPVEYKLKKKAESLKVITEDSCCGPVPIPSDKRKEVATFSFAIDDKRKDKEISSLYDTDYINTLTGISLSGKYSVLQPDGKFLDMYVSIVKQFTTDTGSSAQPLPASYVVIDNAGKAIKAKRTPTIKGDLIDSGASIFDKGIDISTLTAGKSQTGKFAFVDKQGNTAIIAEVMGQEVVGGKTIGLKIYVSEPNNVNADMLYISDADNAAVSHKDPSSYSGSMTMSSKYWKAIPITTNTDFRFGDTGDLLMGLSKAGVHSLDVYSDNGQEFTISLDGIKKERLGYKEATITLVRDMGLREDQTLDIIKQASFHKKSNKFIKFAQGVGVQYNPPQDLSQGGVDSFTGIPLTVPSNTSAQQPLDGGAVLQDSMQPNFATTDTQGAPFGGQGGPGAMGDEVQQLTQQAAANGQKTVFDQSVVGGLAKLHDSTDTIDSFLPDFLDTLDKLGRVLFLFYWKADNFIERYGEDGYSDMENSLKATYNSFGELVHMLREKAIDENDVNETAE